MDLLKRHKTDKCKQICVKLSSVQCDVFMRIYVQILSEICAAKVQLGIRLFFMNQSVVFVYNAGLVQSAD